MTSPKQDLTAKPYNELTILFQHDEVLSQTYNGTSWETVEMMAKACFIFTHVQLEHLKEKYHER